VVRVPGYRSRGPGFDYRCYQIFCEVVGLERGPLSLVRITEELLDWKSSSGSGSRKPRLWPWGSVALKLVLSSPTGCGRSVGIVRLRTKTTEFSLVRRTQCESCKYEYPDDCKHPPPAQIYEQPMYCPIVVYFPSICDVCRITCHITSSG
jgi:hypothetical protein